MSKNEPPSGAMPVRSCRQAARFRVMDLTGLDEIILAEKGQFRRIPHLEKDVYQVQITNLGDESSECYIQAMGKNSGDLLFFNDLNQQKPAKHVKLPKKLVEKIITHQLSRFQNLLPPSAELKDIIEQQEEITGYKLYELQWGNNENPNDYISIIFNPASEKIFNYIKKWSL